MAPGLASTIFTIKCNRLTRNEMYALQLNLVSDLSTSSAQASHKQSTSRAHAAHKHRTSCDMWRTLLTTLSIISSRGWTSVNAFRQNPTRAKGYTQVCDLLRTLRTTLSITSSREWTFVNMRRENPNRARRYTQMCYFWRTLRAALSIISRAENTFCEGYSSANTTRNVQSCARQDRKTLHNPWTESSAGTTL